VEVVPPAIVVPPKDIVVQVVPIVMWDVNVTMEPVLKKK